MSDECKSATDAPAGPAEPPHEWDVRGLIAEAFKIEGIVEADCRSIFFDWALGVPDGADMRAGVKALLAQYSDQPEDHPMRRVLMEGLRGETKRPRRSGARRRRPGPASKERGESDGGEDSPNED